MQERDPPDPRLRPRNPPASVSAPAFTAGDICVVGIGASAGGLEACKQFLAALPASPGMAFILVQHLDPTHDSLMVELLDRATVMPVVQAADGMMIAIDHLYIIPPGAYLALNNGVLNLTKPVARHGARLPFDFLLNSLAAAGTRAICVILSGSGADGAIGLRAVKAAGGMVIAQDPLEAGFDGMPRSAMATGEVDFVLPVEKIAGKLLEYRKKLGTPLAQSGLARIIALLKAKTPHDFSLYKTGTLERRIARRMALAGLESEDSARYLETLENDESERQLLIDDLLINVTGFFRDPQTFDILAASMVPELVSGAADRPIRLWIAGCSTGEETYSLAMLLQEHILAENSAAKLQIFASDVDRQAVAAAREGFYPLSIAAQVSAPRLARFFVKEEAGYRVSQALRGCVVFAVQDVLADPPFSKLDLISCRNLLIYLRPEAQAKVISVFNFALRDGGFLLLGAAETAGNPDGRFSAVSKPARLYRKTATSSARDLRLALSGSETIRGLARPDPFRQPPSRTTDIAEICRKLVLDCYAPAAILVNAKMECIYSSGPASLYLRLAPGFPSHNVFSMMAPALGGKAKSAIALAVADNRRVSVPGGRVVRDGATLNFNIDVQPVPGGNEKLLLVCFVDQPAQAAKADPDSVAPPQAGALERELELTRAELHNALRSLEIATEEQNAINEEALSVNEEYQSTNEELLTSKEELQSLNEELTALNSQLLETLERSRTNSNDLQNVLYSTDVATLFLDTKFNIRFFTPAATQLFAIRQTDVGRPLSDFHARTADQTFLEDAKAVLQNSTMVEQEIQSDAGAWFNRRTLPYRTHDGVVAGVVMTFTDITERNLNRQALETARRESDRANIAKSRFLAAASHDLRQPLQTLALVSRLLGRVVTDEPGQKLIRRLDATMNAMTGMLNALLDINQIDAGVIHADITSFPINHILKKLHAEFEFAATAQGTQLRKVPCSLIVAADARLLEQMIRNLLANALKYTKAGRVLLGCRRTAEHLRIEIWDTGIGIAADQLQEIFEEYHQIDNAARERSRGLGLGLSIVRRLGELMALKVDVRSAAGKGSVFSIEVPVSRQPIHLLPDPGPALPEVRPASAAQTGRILVIEDDPDIRQLLELFLTDEGHEVAVADSSNSALALVASGAVQPDLILADYNLTRSETGLQAACRIRALLGREVPVIIVTGDISTATLRCIAAENCIQMNKPMKLGELTDAIQRVLSVKTPVTGPPEKGRIFSSGD